MILPRFGQFPLRVTALCIAVLLQLPSPLQAAEGSTDARPSYGVDRFLTPEGEFDVQAARVSGFEGTIDLQGYTARFRPGLGHPVFTRTTEDDRHWAREFGTRGTWNPAPDPEHVYAFAQIADGTVIGGKFTWIAGLEANNIALWNGLCMEPLGQGMNGAVHALAIYQGDLVAGGEFTEADGDTVNYIARWDGSAWRALGSGMDAGVHALAVHGDYLVAGGYFTTAGGVAAQSIARWDSTAWSPLGDGIWMDPSGSPCVLALTVYNDHLIAGGTFNMAGDVSVNLVAKWDSSSSSWSALGSGLTSGSNVVRALTVSGKYLVAGGDFASAGGLTASHVARWDDQTQSWSALGSEENEGVGSDVWALADDEGELVLGGDFETAGTLSTPHIARWTGTDWAACDGGLDARVEGLQAIGDSLFVGGVFTGGVVGGEMSFFECPAWWDGTAWHGFGQGVGEAYALAWFNGRLIVGTGPTTQAGDAVLHGVGQWDGHAWSPMEALDGSVSAFAMYDNELIASGQFTGEAGGSPRNIARWDGNQWVSLDPSNEPDDRVMALLVWHDTLVAGGRFHSVGSQSMNHIAGWNGSSWSFFGQGMNEDVGALAAYKDSLVAGGSFSSSGATMLHHVALWTGTLWSPVGGGTNHIVEALEVWNGSLVAGGRFTSAGDSAANHIASWDGQHWSPLGTGVDSAVCDLGVFNGSLIVGGSFTQAGGGPASHIARYDGSGWLPLGSGLDNNPSSTSTWQFLSVAESLYVAGEFWSAGGFSSSHIARWTDFCLPETVDYGGLPHTGLEGLCLDLADTSLVMTGFGWSGSRGVSITIDDNRNRNWRASWVPPSPMPDNSSTSTVFYGNVDGHNDQLIGSIDVSEEPGSGTKISIDCDIPGQTLLLYEATLNGVPAGSTQATNGIAKASPGAGTDPMIDEQSVSVESPLHLPVLLVRWKNPVELMLPGQTSGTGADCLRITPAATSGNFFAVTHVVIHAAGPDQIILSDEEASVGDLEEAPDGNQEASHLLALIPARPNPMTAVTTLAYTLPAPAAVRMEVFDLQGRRVARLVNRTQDPGLHRVDWDGRDDRGRGVGSGVYFVRLRALDQVRTSRVILTR
jgi:hypothetical protein